MINLRWLSAFDPDVIRNSAHDGSYVVETPRMTYMLTSDSVFPVKRLRRLMPKWRYHGEREMVNLLRPGRKVETVNLPSFGYLDAKPSRMR